MAEFPVLKVFVCNKALNVCFSQKGGDTEICMTKYQI